jgi:polyhydroxyalkanoate synthesis regulator phasin
MPEELETILRLVAEGHLTPDEASPIIEALTRTERAAADDDLDAHFDSAFDDDAVADDFDAARPDLRRLERVGERIDRKVTRRIERAQARAESARARAEERVREAQRVAATLGGGRQLRIKITERGRQVVNLRIPIGFVETALKFVPGLGGDQSQRIRDAVRSGAVGPILDVEDPDGEGGVLISVE